MGGGKTYLAPPIFLNGGVRYPPPSDAPIYTYTYTYKITFKTCAKSPYNFEVIGGIACACIFVIFIILIIINLLTNNNYYRLLYKIHYTLL